MCTRKREIRVSMEKWNSPAERLKMVKYNPPAEGFKLNTDGCSNSNLKLCGRGGILRDDKGKVIFAFACPFGYGSSLEAEFKAMLHGIHLYCEKGISSFQGESDSLILVNILSGKVSCLWPLKYLYEDICRARQKLSTISHLF